MSGPKENEYLTTDKTSSLTTGGGEEGQKKRKVVETIPCSGMVSRRGECG